MENREINTYRLCSSDELDIIKTFECGQCFRWNADEKGVYRGVAFGKAARVWNDGGEVYISTDAPLTMWLDYFDLHRDYREMSRFDGGEYLNKCVEYGMGIRILNQEPWEALCSFIISQCNNITRIKGIVEKLCALFGDEIEFEGEKYYSFPQPQCLAVLSPEDLAPLRSGYRAPYIIKAAESIVNGDIDLDALIDCSYTEAKKALLSLTGVGEKVANCVVLFGLRHMEGFPVDVWIKRALKEHFPPDFKPETLGEYAGLAQQYIFYYARENKDGVPEKVKNEQKKTKNV